MTEFTKEELETLSEALDILEVVNQQQLELRLKIDNLIKNYRDPNCIHKIDKELKKCCLCGLPSRCIPCVGGWL